MLFWAPRVAEVMSVSQIQGTHLPLRIVLGDRYHHHDFPIPDRSWTLDNTTITQALFAMGRKMEQREFARLKDCFFQDPNLP